MTRQLPTGMPSGLEYPDCAVGDIVAGSARRFPDHVALRDGDLDLTYRELYDHALRVAQGLRERGVAPGDVVAVHQPNSAWFPVTYYGILLAGAVVTPVNPTVPPAALADQLTESAAVAVITHASTAPALAEARAEGVRLTVVVPASHAAPAGPATGAQDGRLPGEAVPLADLLSAHPSPATPVSAHATAHLAFTGGTTGRSKAVRVLHRNVVANVLQMGCWRAAALPRLDESGGLRLEQVPEARTPYVTDLGSGITIGVAPLFHAMGLVGLTIGVVTGTTVVMMGRFDPARFLADAERYRVTSIAGSPALYHALLAAPGVRERDFGSVRVVNSGAAPMDSPTVGRLREVFPNACVVEGYGLTEATMALTAHLTDDDCPAPPGSVGVAVFDTELSIRAIDGDPESPEGRGGPEELPVGEIGELWARGPQVTDGYLGHPGLTAEQFRGGWLRTGDIGRVDKDGWLFLVGRAKDMLIYKGYNVYPAPLEDVLHQHPAVALASVIGAPHEEAGEIPVAYVVPRPGERAGDGLARSIMEFVAERVAPYQRVREVRFADALPTSAAGKILKTELRRRHAQATAGG